MFRSILLFVVLSIVAAATPALARDCFNPDRVRDFQVLSSTQVRVDAGYGDYLVTLSRSCPQLVDARYLAFSGEAFAARHLPPTAWRDPALADVAVIAPIHRVCGRSEWLVATGGRSSFSQPGCRIIDVERLP